MLAVSICPFAVFLLLLMFSVVHSQFKNMDEYNGFLDMIDMQQKEAQTERETKYFYRLPEHLKSKYREDRHGAGYIKCRSFNSSIHNEKPVNVRCPIKNSNYLQTCQLTYDYDRREVYQGCWEIAPFDQDTCRKECDLKFETVDFEGQPHMNKRVGFCCCKTQNCNVDLERIIATGIRRNRENMPEFVLTPAERYLHSHPDDEDLAEAQALTGLQSPGPVNNYFN